jgi:hypothetical protein
MTVRQKDRVYLSFFLLLSAVAGAYVWARAFTVPFTIDEAATFFMYIQTGRFIPPDAAVDANNHLLNSLFTWLSYQAGGANPIVLRLPNVLAAAVYFFYTYKLAQKVRLPMLRYGFTILMLCTHFIIEFFGYSRGYGLSLAMISAAIYFLFEAYRLPKSINVFPALLFTILSVFANLNLIFTGLTMTGLLALFVVVNGKASLRKKILFYLLPLIAVSLPAFWFLVSFSFRIRDFSGYYYGSAEGFRSVTVNSLSGFITGLDDNLTGIVFILICMTVVTLLIISIFRKKEHSADQHLPFIFLTLLLINWIGAVGLNQVFQVNYQEDRAAIHLLPLFYGVVIFSLDSLINPGRYLWTLLLIPLLLIPIHTVRQISLGKSLYGSNQQVPENQFHHILNESENGSWPPVVSAYQIKRLPWAFLNLKHGGVLNPIHAEHFPSRIADFIITREPLPESMKNSYVPVMNDQRSGNVLFQRTTPVHLQALDTFRLENPLSAQRRYNDLVKFNATRLAGKNILIQMDFWVESDAMLLEGGFVAEVFDSTRKNLYYSPLDIDQLKARGTSPIRHIHHSVLIENIPEGADNILLYFWNKREHKFTLNKGEAILYVISDKEPQN